MVVRTCNANTGEVEYEVRLGVTVNFSSYEAG